MAKLRVFIEKTLGYAVGAAVCAAAYIGRIAVGFKAEPARTGARDLIYRKDGPDKQQAKDDDLLTAKRQRGFPYGARQLKALAHD